jgi:hypothetical protein
MLLIVGSFTWAGTTFGLYSELLSCQGLKFGKKSGKNQAMKQSVDQMSPKTAYSIKYALERVEVRQNDITIITAIVLLLLLYVCCC